MIETEGRLRTFFPFARKWAPLPALGGGWGYFDLTFSVTLVIGYPSTMGAEKE